MQTTYRCIALFYSRVTIAASATSWKVFHAVAAGIPWFMSADHARHFSFRFPLAVATWCSNGYELGKGNAAMALEQTILCCLSI